MANSAYFSELIGKPVFDYKGEKIGVLADLAFKDGENLAEITHAVVKNSKKFRIEWKCIASISNAVFLYCPKEKLKREELEDSDLLINDILLDRQLVDTNGLKVVRVNDVLLSKIGEKFFISSVAVGITSLLKRLGVEKIVLALKPGLKPVLIPWAYVQALSLSPAHLSLNLSKTKINKVHPADIADLLEELSHSERNILFNALNDEKAADTFAESNPNVQRSLMEHLHAQKIKRLVKNLSPDEIADLSTALSGEKMQHIARHVDGKKAEQVSQILKYPKISVGGLMKAELISIPENYTVGQTLAFLRKQKTPESPYYFYLINEENKLSGVVSIRDLVFPNPKSRVKSLAEQNLVFLHANDNLKKAAKTFFKYHFLALPVIDDNSTLIGTIQMSDVFDEVLPKAWQTEPVRTKPVRVRKNHE